jgi:hypothetical protein
VLPRKVGCEGNEVGDPGCDGDSSVARRMEIYA